MLGGLPGAIFIFRAVSDSQHSGAVLPVILTNREYKERYSVSNFALKLMVDIVVVAERITIAARLVCDTSRSSLSVSCSPCLADI
jgi:hypothetical protein